MRAVLCTAFEKPAPLEIGEIDAPLPADDEIVIDVRAAAVSYMDMLMTQGDYQMRPDLPYVPGTDGAGIVTAVGKNVTRFKTGDRVAAQNWHGAFAERMAAKEWKCAHIPDTMSYETASAVLHNYLTAYYGLGLRAMLQPGETLFVTGAAGGVGLAAIDTGRMMGARVIAGIGDDSKAAIVREMGADEVVNYRGEDLRGRIKELTGGKGLDVCFEMVGGDIFATASRLMAWNGRLLPIGFTSGEIPALPMNLPLLKNYSVVGVFAGAWIDSHREEAAVAADKVMKWVAAGELNPQIDKVIPLEDAAEAMRMISERKVKGRVVLQIGA